MGRQPKKTEVDEGKPEELLIEEVVEQSVPEIEGEKEVTENKEEPKDVVVPDTEEISPRIDSILKLYPQYEEMWITDRGFVHPVGAADYLLKNAKLYKNKYFNQ